MPRTLLILSLLLTSASCDELPNDLPAGDLSSVYYWGDFFLAKYAAEIELANTEIEAGPEPLAEPRVVLLITGVTIPGEWLGPISKRLVRDGFIPYLYEPPELLSGDLFEAAAELGDIVEQVRAETGHDTIDILAECTGGVIARHYVQSLGGDKYIDRLVTFVSPQAGVAKAPLAAKFADWKALEGLTPGSDFLTAVASVPLPETVDMTSIYSCTDEYIQPYSSSIVEGATNIGLCDGFVGHFQTMYDPEIYLIMHGALIEPLSFDNGTNTVGDDGDDSDQFGDDSNPNATEAGCSAAGSRGSNGALLLLGLALVLAFRPRQRSILRS